MTLGEVVFILLSLENHMLTSSCPDPSGKWVWENSFPAKKQTSQAGWLFSRRPHCPVDVQVLCKQEKSHYKHLCKLFGMGQEQIIHHGAICLKKTALSEQVDSCWSTADSLRCCCVFIYLVHHIKWKVRWCAKYVPQYGFLRVQIKILRPHWSQSLSMESY